MTSSPQAVADVLRIVADAYDKSCGCDGKNQATSFATMLREAARSAGGGVRIGMPELKWDTFTHSAPAPAATTAHRHDFKWKYGQAFHNGWWCSCGVYGGEVPYPVPETPGPAQPGREPERADDGGSDSRVKPDAGPEDRPDTPIGNRVEIAAGRRTGPSAGDAKDAGGDSPVLSGTSVGRRPLNVVSGVREAAGSSPAPAASPVPPPTPPDAAQGKAMDVLSALANWTDAKKKFPMMGAFAIIPAGDVLYATLVRVSSSTPAAPPAQGEGRTSTWTDRPTCAGCGAKRGDPECHVCGEEAARDALEKLATLPMFAPPTPAVPESGLRECPSQDEIVNRLVADGADRISAGWYASGYVTAWNARPSPQAAIRVVGAEVVAVIDEIRLAIERGDEVPRFIRKAYDRLQSTGGAGK